MDEKSIISKGIRLLSDVDEKEYFSVINGVVLKNVKELASLLETIHIDHFGYHVNEHKNDFYNWIKFSVGDEDLSERIKEAKSPDVMRLIILERIKELEDKLESYEDKYESSEKLENYSGSKYEKEVDDLDSFFEEKENSNNKDFFEQTKERREDYKDNDVEEEDFSSNDNTMSDVVEKSNLEQNSKSSYSHEEILEEIEKALNETDSVLGLKNEDKKSLNEESSIVNVEHKGFSWIDFILGFIFGFILGLLLVVAYYKMYVIV